jgi:hypothetical protein
MESQDDVECIDFFYKFVVHTINKKQNGTTKIKFKLSDEVTLRKNV